MKQVRMDPRTRRRLNSARRVRDLLRAAIVHEEFPAGALPGEAELMLSFCASRQVIRDALGLLREEGLIKRVQGTGTFSVASKVRHAFSHLHGPEPALERVSHRILTVTREVAAPRVTDRLGLPRGSECGVIEYLAVFGDEPYYVCTAYVPLPLIRVVERGRSVTEWYQVYEAAGFEIGVTDQAVEAILADDEVAGLLDVLPGAPLMLFERLVRDRTGQPLEYAFARVRGDRIALLAQLPRHSRQRRPHPSAQET
ncbi:GntR family transcriptional regulator [Nocardia sp. alder85J]|uniref:GntR family transcriptional regulator n=1 Tax=Nocardia sp. alder85J TaxID=2862949 RepID=UPI001CD1EDF1|nr:GntR family transcriptional regulator [Nocardia sp. alder85J]MCX4093868.1 GntR family transcriptional regulator [Nocardia sp. alder85J]